LKSVLFSMFLSLNINIANAGRLRPDNPVA
jgi:hypothetical protein